MKKYVATFVDLLNQLKEDRVAHARDITLPGFRAIAVYRFGVWVKTLPAIFRFWLFPFYVFCYRWIRNHYGIQLYYTAQLGRRVVLANQGNISIHKEAVIGDDCVIRQNVTIGGVSKAKNVSPELGNGVDIGAGAVLIGPIHIGDNARIGPNAVIMQDVPAGAMAFAPPTKIVPPKREPGLQADAPNAGSSHDQESLKASISMSQGRNGG